MKVFVDKENLARAITDAFPDVLDRGPITGLARVQSEVVVDEVNWDQGRGPVVRAVIRRLRQENLLGSPLFDQLRRFGPGYLDEIARVEAAVDAWKGAVPPPPELASAPDLGDRLVALLRAAGEPSRAEVIKAYLQSLPPGFEHALDVPAERLLEHVVRRLSELAVPDGEASPLLVFSKLVGLAGGEGQAWRDAAFKQLHGEDAPRARLWLTQARGTKTTLWSAPVLSLFGSPDSEQVRPYLYLSATPIPLEPIDALGLADDPVTALEAVVPAALAACEGFPNVHKATIEFVLPLAMLDRALEACCQVPRGQDIFPLGAVHGVVVRALDRLQDGQMRSRLQDLWDTRRAQLADGLSLDPYAPGAMVEGGSLHLLPGMDLVEFSLDLDDVGPVAVVVDGGLALDQQGCPVAAALTSGVPLLAWTRSGGVRTLEGPVRLADRLRQVPVASIARTVRGLRRTAGTDRRSVDWQEDWVHIGDATVLLFDDMSRRLPGTHDLAGAALVPGGER